MKDLDGSLLSPRSETALQVSQKDTTRLTGSNKRLSRDQQRQNFTGTTCSHPTRCDRPLVHSLKTCRICILSGHSNSGSIHQSEFRKADSQSWPALFKMLRTWHLLASLGRVLIIWCTTEVNQAATSRWNYRMLSLSKNKTSVRDRPRYHVHTRWTPLLASSTLRRTTAQWRDHKIAITAVNQYKTNPNARPVTRLSIPWRWTYTYSKFKGRSVPEISETNVRMLPIALGLLISSNALSKKRLARFSAGFDERVITFTFFPSAFLHLVFPSNVSVPILREPGRAGDGVDLSPFWWLPPSSRLFVVFPILQRVQFFFVGSPGSLQVAAWRSFRGDR